MRKILITASILLAFADASRAMTFYVATTGSDTNSGSADAPLRTIQRAADLAQPGDVVTVRAGIYRERVNPVRAGLPGKRITYQAAPGEHVVITGSEPVTHWVKLDSFSSSSSSLKPKDIWQATVPNALFGSFNPYTNIIHGDWFSPMGRVHHTGAVYLNDNQLYEATNFGEVVLATNALWFAQVDATNTTIWARFKHVNPNRQHVEINARQTVFYPEKTGINYITVRGFTLEDAATPWAPPTAEQMGLIGTHWSKGWIIESNIVRNSMCVGIALGKYGDEWDNRAQSAIGYVGTINRALTNGWNKDTVGSHVVRDNDISFCGQAGIVGSLGCSFSTVTGNVIHDIDYPTRLHGAEMAGIKFHGAVDVTISHNQIYRTIRGLWLDWMAQGARISGNLFHDDGSEDMFFEVDHGPYIVDNNLSLSRHSVVNNSQGGAYVHNLFAGSFNISHYDARQTPYMKAHSTEVVALHDNPRGDDRFYNNIFVRYANLSAYDHVPLRVWMDGNVFLDGAKPSAHETNALVEPQFDPALKLVPTRKGLHLQMKFDAAWISDRPHKLITTALLGKAVIPDVAFEMADSAAVFTFPDHFRRGHEVLFEPRISGYAIITTNSSGRLQAVLSKQPHPLHIPILIATDYFGKPRNQSNPTPGPFEAPGNGNLKLKVWPQ